jgi:hypothetical protein
MDDDMDKLSKAFLAAIALGMVSGLAQSRSLHVTGTAGYLSEWELSGTVTPRTATGSSEFFGPLIWRHVGLCSVSGPQEKPGEIRFRVRRSGPVSLIDATISLDGVQCVYSADFSGSSNGHMDCSDAKGVPLSISIK